MLSTFRVLVCSALASDAGQFRITTCERFVSQAEDANLHASRLRLFWPHQLCQPNEASSQGPRQVRWVLMRVSEHKRGRVTEQAPSGARRRLRIAVVLVAGAGA